jgi:hypothetical protein
VTQLATLVRTFYILIIISPPRRWPEYRPRLVGENIVNKMQYIINIKVHLLVICILWMKFKSLMCIAF